MSNSKALWPYVGWRCCVFGDLPPCLKSGLPICMYTLLLWQSGSIYFPKQFSLTKMLISFETIITEMNTYFKIKSQLPKKHTSFSLCLKAQSLCQWFSKWAQNLTRDAKSQTPLPEICILTRLPRFLGSLKFDRH